MWAMIYSSILDATVANANDRLTVGSAAATTTCVLNITKMHSNRDLDGDPRLRRNDKRIDFNWETGRPDSCLPRDDFSVKWTREYDFDKGTYRFFARADDGLRAWIEDDRIFNEWHDSGGSELYVVDRHLDGRYDLKIEYYERTGGIELNSSGIV